MFFWRRVAPQSPEEGTKPTATPGYLRNFQEINRKISEGKSFSGYERNGSFLNLNGKGFADVGLLCGTDLDDDARAVASLDWDHDGDLDLWVTNRTAPRVRLLRNNHPQTNRFLAVRLVGNGTTTNRDAVGARVALRHMSGSQPAQLRTIRAGDGFIAQSSPWVHFGLGAAENGAIQLAVAWPGGKTETFDGLLPNAHYVIAQGESPKRIDIAQPFELARESSTPQSTTESSNSLWLANPLPFPRLSFTDTTNANHTTAEFRGRPVLVNLWATWCRPCLQELGQFAKNKESLAAHNATVLALNVDGLSNADPGTTPEADIEQVLARIGFDMPQGKANREGLAKIEVLMEFLSSRRSQLAVPSSFLLNAEGQVVAVYSGALSWDQLASDIAMSQEAVESQLKRVTPREGRWLGDPRKIDQTARLGDLATSYAKAGFADESEWLYSLNKPREGVEQARTLFNRAKLAGQQGQRQKAKQYYEEAIALDPNFGQALSGLGTLLLAERRVDEAEKLFERALRVDPNHAVALINLAMIDRVRGRNDQAVERLEQVIERNPDFVEAHLNLGSLLAVMKQHERAIEHLQKTLSLSPRNEAALLNLAQVYSETEQWEQAEKVYRQVAMLNPRQPFVHVGLGTLAAKQAQHAVAVGEFRKAIQMGLASPRVFTDLGLALLATGDRPGAKEAVMRALKIDPNYAPAREALQKMEGSAD